MKTLPPGATEAACEGCGKRIWWIATNTGTRVPLDPVAPTYQILLRDSVEPDQPLTGRWVRANAEGDAEPALVSHFATCPAANQFSGRNRRPS